MQFKKILKCDKKHFDYVKHKLESFGYKSLNSPYNMFYVVIVDNNNYVLIRCSSELSIKYNLSKYKMTNIEQFLYEAAKIAGKEYKRKDIVTADDLIGDISGFPIEVVQKMVDYQVKQGNTADVAIFQKKRITPKANGGFNLYETEDGDLWSGVLEFFNFDLFFQKYPKKEKTMKTFTEKDLITGKHIVKFNNGELGIVICDEHNNKYIQLKDSYVLLNDFTDDLIFDANPGYTISAVYISYTPICIFDMTKNDINHFLKPVWKRETVKIENIFDTFEIEGNEIGIEMPNGEIIKIKVE